jgi:Mor family transcriptional regulator
MKPRAEKKLNRRVAEFAAVLHDAAARAVAEVLGAESEAAATAADEVARRVIDAFKGQILYIPTKYQRGLPDTYLAIWRAFDGRNHNDLASRFGCSVGHIYEVIAFMRAVEAEQRQGRLL